MIALLSMAALLQATEPSAAEVHVNNVLRCQATVERLAGLVPGGPEGAHQVVVDAAKRHHEGRLAGVEWPLGSAALLARANIDAEAAEAWHASTRPLMVQVPTPELTNLFRQCVRVYGSTRHGEPVAPPASPAEPPAEAPAT